MINLVIGRGEIGKSVYGVLRGAGSHTFQYDIKDGARPSISDADVLHICIPYSDEFVKIVEDYIKQYRVWHVIIWSTVKIGTTRQINGAVHSPVEGKHPGLGRSIKDSVRWIGANDGVEAEFFRRFFADLMIATHIVENSNYTEALKLMSTTEYGVNIEFARYKKKVANEIGMSYELTKKWNEDYNKLYHNIGIDWAKKYVLDPPDGPKGGHCVTPNAKLLYDQFPDELVKIVGELT